MTTETDRPWICAAVTRRGSAAPRVAAEGRRACQDVVGVRCLAHSRVVIGALADGAGTAPQGRAGAHAAVRAALNALSRGVRRASGGENWLPLLGQAVAEAAAQAVPDRAHACTLIAFAALPGATLAVQIGDGALVLRLAGESHYRRAITREATEHINETTLLAGQRPAPPPRVAVLPPALFVCALTDGLESLSISWTTDHPHHGFFAPLDAYMEQVESVPAARRQLRGFLADPRLTTRTGDDLGLIVAARQVRAEQGV